MDEMFTHIDGYLMNVRWFITYIKNNIMKSSTQSSVTAFSNTALHNDAFSV